ncbi:MAG: hypothetical protein NWE76_08875, partial [Candidatus Bathyarchaeota archaeon]|nr:hypothetical protein [Candidatus Bathyarchaeota archaeon]
LQALRLGVAQQYDVMLPEAEALRAQQAAESGGGIDLSSLLSGGGTLTPASLAQFLPGITQPGEGGRVEAEKDPAAVSRFLTGIFGSAGPAKPTRRNRADRSL